MLSSFEHFGADFWIAFGLIRGLISILNEIKYFAKHTAIFFCLVSNNYIF